MHPWHDIPLPSDYCDWFPVYIGISKGSNVKYELDKPTGMLIASHVLHSAVFYPANFGFVPRTWCADGRPLDVLVLGQEPVVPQVLVRTRAIGVVRLRDKTGEDDKLIGVHVDDAQYGDYRDIAELPEYRTSQLQRFFLVHNILDGGEVVVDGPFGAAKAMPVLREAIHGYERRRGELIKGIVNHMVRAEVFSTQPIVNQIRRDQPI
jgi:inorganic pyrophosphatase